MFADEGDSLQLHGPELRGIRRKLQIVFQDLFFAQSATVKKMLSEVLTIQMGLRQEAMSVWANCLSGRPESNLRYRYPHEFR